MGVQHEKQIQLTIGCAFVARFVSSLEDYARMKATATSIALSAARAVTALSVRASMNTGDELAKGEIFLTVTGTSAEAGDDAGRGNRACGLITPYRAARAESGQGCWRW